MIQQWKSGFTLNCINSHRRNVSNEEETLVNEPYNFIIFFFSYNEIQNAVKNEAQMNEWTYFLEQI